MNSDALMGAIIVSCIYFTVAFFLNNNNNNSMFVFMYILYIMEHSVTLAGCSPIEFSGRSRLSSILFCFVYLSK